MNHRRVIAGLLAAGCLTGLVACGGGSTPTTVDRRFTHSSVEITLITSSATHSADGSSALEAVCADSSVDTSGVGVYKCNITWADGTHTPDQLVKVDSTGALSAG